MLRVDANGIFGIDEKYGEEEYDQKCDSATSNGPCDYSCELSTAAKAVGLTTINAFQTQKSVLDLKEGKEYVVSVNPIKVFPSSVSVLNLICLPTVL